MMETYETHHSGDHEMTLHHDAEHLHAGEAGVDTSDGYTSTFGDTNTVDTTLDTIGDVSQDNPLPGLPGYDETPTDILDGLDLVDPSTVTPDIMSPTMIGEPAVDAQYWLTQGDEGGTCAPTAVAVMLEHITGVHFPDNDAVVDRALQLNLIQYDPDNPDFAKFGGWSGMDQDDIATLARSYGLTVDETTGGTMADLEGYLANDQSVVLFLDADEIWHNTNDDATDGGQGPNHEVVLTGIDPVRGLVYLNDSGQQDSASGAGEVIPIDQFLNAWADSNNSMIVTQEPGSVEASHVSLDSLIGSDQQQVTDPTQTDPTQTDLTQTDPTQTDLTQTDVSQVDPTQSPVQSPIQLDPTQLTGANTAQPGSGDGHRDSWVILPFTFLARVVDELV